jgi:hypothetical protein
VPARHQQRDEREVRPRLGQQRRQQVPFEVVDADDRLAEREPQRVGHARPDQQRAGETRPLGERDAVQVGELEARLGDDLLDQRDQPPDVVARRELGTTPP